MALLLSFLVSSLALAASPPGVLVCHFNGPGLEADVNSFGAVTPELSGFALGPPGSGSPVDGPDGAALDAGYTTSAGWYKLPLSPDTHLGQGTLEFWVRPNWDFGERVIRTLVMFPMTGGMWNSVGVGYHGLIGPHSEVFESNINDGLDHPIALEVGPGQFEWKRAEWHHVALTWTEHSQRLFADGKLLGTQTYHAPLLFTPPVGGLWVGCSSTGFGDVAAAMIDELRLCNLPLYAGCNEIPLQTVPHPDALPPGVALAAEGAIAEADSEAPAVTWAEDIPELHDGVYGVPVRIGLMPDRGEVTAELAQAAEVRAVVWSRDGRPFAGADGQGWARADSLPRDLVVDVSVDGQNWEVVARRQSIIVDPVLLRTMTAARFSIEFAPRRARFVRLRVTGESAGGRGDWPLLDEVSVTGSDGEPVPVAQVTGERTRFSRSFYAANAIDGRIGEESCWKSAIPGQGALTVQFPAPRSVSQVTWSRSREELEAEGTPAAVVVETSTDGQTFTAAAQVSQIATAGRVTASFGTREARWVRLRVTATTDGKEPIIDEVQVH